MQEETLQKAVALRHHLHQHPELSMEETWTRQTLMDFLRQNTDLEIRDQGHWFCARLPGRGDPRPPIALRADFDAVPVDERPDLVPYASQNPGAAHKCGHDGHSAALAAAAMELKRSGTQREVFLLFQHAEETGQGAQEIVPVLQQWGVGEIYGCHNLPGLPLGHLCVPDDAAQPASSGLILRFTGLKSHASRPEDGINPAFAISRIVTELPALTDPARSRGLVLATVIGIHVGERAFGTSPGYGELLLTLRGEYEEEYQTLCHRVEDLARTAAKQDGLTVSLEWTDVFPATRNRPDCAAAVRNAAVRLGIPVLQKMDLFRASEDFGWYTRSIPGAIFYLGSGEHCPPLHTPDYDYPDVLLRTAGDLFVELAQ